MEASKDVNVCVHIHLAKLGHVGPHQDSDRDVHMANHREVTDSEDHILIDCLLPTTYSGVVLVRVIITVEYEEIEKIRGYLYFRGKLDRKHCYIRDLTNHYTAAERTNASVRM